VNGGECAADISAAVNRVIDFSDMIGQLFIQFTHPCGRGCGDDDLEVGHALLENADDLRADIDLADADGVHPNDISVGKRLFDFAIVDSESFEEAAHPIPAPPHAPEIIWRCQPEKKREQYVVKGAHSNDSQTQMAASSDLLQPGN
jgi:hypothetical protein